ncbi:hypothetical protein AKJ09_07056 [Labilithrix luteola]|uniref:Tyrosine specific protein phosphatases domain-containing protein n=1 Tax=Labilithrix luteola TaxID=1391654 RepID=A0A0K1Q3R5_9BACT|nr:dual specificity protein phosphatase family protein [Labilithrix luteola]AKV00393.1 hypothetical protein AKJ09_07056 [Labilithrix luteola]
MQFYVYSRYGFEATRPHEVPHVVISITSSLDDQARIRANEQCRGVLRLAFADAEVASEIIPEDALFTPEHARRIWDFVVAHRDEIERIIVHCDAGMSRSPAVAAALARALNGDDAEFFGGRYVPNPRVYRLVLECATAQASRP